MKGGGNLPNIFGYFEAVPTDGRQWWGCYYDSIKTALTKISQIQGLPDDFIIDYIKFKEGVGIRIEYENAGGKASFINEILRDLEKKTVGLKGE
jgi:hypothetical protein